MGLKGHGEIKCKSLLYIPIREEDAITGCTNIDLNYVPRVHN
jgi:hypothetical protein